MMTRKETGYGRFKYAMAWLWVKKMRLFWWIFSH